MSVRAGHGACARSELVGVSYSAEGYPLGDGAGQVMLFWGSHVGSIRERALNAWDYDAYLAVFYHEDDFALIWNSAKRQLQHL